MIILHHKNGLKNINTFKTNFMYSLEYNDYTSEFSTIEELVNDIVSKGLDPSIEITKNGKKIGQDLISFMIF